MFKDASLNPDEMVIVMDKIEVVMKKMRPAEIPPLIYQVKLNLNPSLKTEEKHNYNPLNKRLWTWTDLRGKGFFTMNFSYSGEWSRERKIKR